jgi:hypothetical protein
MSYIRNPTRPADDWSRAKAAEMFRAGCHAGTIIRHLEAYGIGLYAAQNIVRNLQAEALIAISTQR